MISRRALLKLLPGLGLLPAVPKVLDEWQPSGEIGAVHGTYSEFAAEPVVKSCYWICAPAEPVYDFMSVRWDGSFF